MKGYGALLGFGAILIAAAALLGGPAAATGGAVALAAQTWAVRLLRPAMSAPTPQFMAHWLGGIATRAVALALVMVAAVWRSDLLPVLPTALGFLGVMLPLLFLENRFLR